MSAPPLPDYPNYQSQQQQQYFAPPPGPPPAHSNPATPYQQGQAQFYPPPPTSPPQQQQQSPQNQQQQFFPPPPPPPISPPSEKAQYAPPPTQPPPHQQQQQQATPIASPQEYHSQAFNPANQSLPGPIVQNNSLADTVGTFNGGSYRIDHRDTNTLVTIQLAHGCPLTAKSGAMVAMSPTLTVKGQVKFSLKKLISGSDLTQTQYTGPGELLLAPAGLGDIIPIRLDGTVAWNLSKDGFLACTQGVVREHKAQGFGKAMLSGEGLFVYKFTGNGVLFVTSLGAIIQKDLSEGEQYIVDNGHLVAWNCKYTLAQVTSGGLISSFSAGEGVVCKFTGPGTVFIQTRNPHALGAWMMQAGASVGR